jgi:hypothetical protein
MRVIYFTDTFLPKIDGITISIKNFSERLSQRGYEFLILCPEYGEGDFSEINPKIRIERFASGYLPTYPDIKVVLPNPLKISKIIYINFYSSQLPVDKKMNALLILKFNLSIISYI